MMKWLLPAAVVLLMWNPAALHCAETPVRLALLPQGTGVEARNAADLLMLELGRQPGMELVDRQEIERVLKEQAISLEKGSDHESALRVGRLCSADAIAAIEPQQSGTNKFLRLRVVDVKTTIKLDDVLASLRPDEAEMASLSDRLARAAAKSLLPGELRHFVGVLGFVSEETGSVLDVPAQSLGLFVEQDLNACPNVTVLDREMVKRLEEEQQLTGTDLSIKAAAVLLDGTLRRDMRNRTFAASLRLFRIGGRETESFRVTAPMDDLPALRSAVRAAITKSASLSGLPLQSAPVSDVEIERLASYAGLLLSFGQPARALALSESALAMKSNETALAVARDAHMAFSNDRGVDRLERIRHRVSGNRYNRQWIEKRVATPGGLGDWPFTAHFCRYGLWNLPIEPRTPDIDELLRELDSELVPALRLALADVERRASTMRDLDMALGSCVSFAETANPTPAEWTRDIQSILGRFETNFVTRYPRHEGFNVYNHLHILAGNEGQKWRPQERLGLLKWLSAHQEPTYRIVGYEGMTFLDDPTQRVDAAMQVLRLATDPDIQARRDIFIASAAWRAAIVLEVERKSVVVMNDLLSEAEKSQDPAAPGRYATVFTELMSRLPAQEQKPMCRRALRLMAADTSGSPYVQLLKDRIRAVLPESEIGGADPIAKANPWDEYAVEQIQLRGVPAECRSIVHIAGPSRGASEEIVAVWNTSSTGTIFTAVDVGTGRVRTIGSSPRGSTAAPATRIRDIRSAGDGALFFYTDGTDLQVVRNGTVRILSEADGLPNRVIRHMAFDGKALVMAHPGAMSRYDPAEDKLTMLISSRSMTPKCALDGQRRYDIFALSSSPTNTQTFISVRAWEPDLVGLWVYDSSTDQFEHQAGKLIASSIFWEGQDMRMLVGGHLYRCDSSGKASGEGTYERLGFFSEIHSDPHVVLGSHVIHASGLLNTLDRQTVRIQPNEHSARWTDIARHGTAAIAARDSAIWHIKRKSTEGAIRAD